MDLTSNITPLSFFWSTTYLKVKLFWNLSFPEQSWWLPLFHETPVWVKDRFTQIWGRNSCAYWSEISGIFYLDFKITRIGIKIMVAQHSRSGVQGSRADLRAPLKIPHLFVTFPAAFYTDQPQASKWTSVSERYEPVCANNGLWDNVSSIVGDVIEAECTSYAI